MVTDYPVKYPLSQDQCCRFIAMSHMTLPAITVLPLDMSGRFCPLAPLARITPTREVATGVVAALPGIGDGG
jgi:hypothetical protein